MNIRFKRLLTQFLKSFLTLFLDFTVLTIIRLFICLIYEFRLNAMKYCIALDTVTLTNDPIILNCHSQPFHLTFLQSKWACRELFNEQKEV